MRTIALLLGFLTCCTGVFVQNTYMPAIAEIVIDKLEDPPYLNPDGTSYTKVKEGVNPKTGNRTVTVQRGANIGSSSLTRLENRVFGRNFIGDTGLNRLCRLERQVFGAVQSGNTNNRLQRLKVASRSFGNNYAAMNNNYYYNNPFNPNIPYQPYRRPSLREMFQSFKNGGAMTGFSPPVTNFNQSYFNPAYSSYYNRGNYTDIFSNGGMGKEVYSDNGEYRKNVSNLGGGMGVKIIY